MSDLMGGYYKARKKATSTTPSGGRSKPKTTEPSSADFSGALKETRAELEKVEAAIDTPTVRKTEQELRDRQRREALQSAVKTLSEAVDRQRSARMESLGAQPIDDPSQPFTFGTPAAIGSTGLYAPVGGKENVDVTSRGMLFKSSRPQEDREAAAKRLNTRRDAALTKARDLQKQKRETQEFLEYIAVGPDETAPEYLARLDPIDRGVSIEDRKRRAARAERARERLQELEAQSKRVADDIAVIDRGLILTGVEPKQPQPVTPSRVAAKARQQRTAAPQKAEDAVAQNEQPLYLYENEEGQFDYGAVE